VLARRAAPIQATYLGYPGTTGDPNIDYIIADRIVIPPSDRDNFCERIVYLPNSYQPNDDRRRIADPSPSRRDLGLPEDAFVYCCFNTALKLTPAMFDQWMRILAATPSSVLWLVEHNKLASANLRREAEKRGITSDRIVFAPFAEQADHLARIRQADLFLDTTPYNAHTTTSDALWAGVPVLTRPGATFAGRVAASLLHAVGLPELILTTPEQYEGTAIALARDRERLDGIWQKLLENIRTSPLFDTQRFARDLESAFAVMHARRVANKAPVDINIAQ
jgi:predicted O-linked N-acetylglucosamine transferase (SPINDLY family)